MRAVTHSQTQQAWCLVLQVENNATSSRDEGSVLVDSACEVHLTDQNLVENIIAAWNRSLQQYGKNQVALRVLRTDCPSRALSN